VSKKWDYTGLGAWKKSRETKKVLYHFAIFVIINDLLITKIAVLIRLTA